MNRKLGEVVPDNAVIFGGRGTGKSYELIKKSNEGQIPILVSTKEQARFISLKARSLDIDIPQPITVSELPTRKGSGIDKLLVDNAESVLRAITGFHIVNMSVESEILYLPTGGEIHG